MAGEDLGELLGKLLESFLNPQAPGGGKTPPGAGQPGAGQPGAGQRGPGQRGPGQSSSGQRGSGQPSPGERGPDQRGPRPASPDPWGAAQARHSSPWDLRPPGTERLRPERRFPDRQGDGQSARGRDGFGPSSAGPIKRPSTGPGTGPSSYGASDPESMLVEAEPVTGDDVAAHVEQYLDPKRVTSRADHFAEEVALADDNLDAHQRELFGQGPRGTLAGRPLGTASAAPPTATTVAASGIAKDVTALLRSPENLRAAFLLGEILRRPEW